MGKKVFTAILAIIALFEFSLPCYALSDTQSNAIQSLLDDACRISGVPGMSISILNGGETYYFSSGFANLEKDMLASEDTLYELASVSKAFTGVGILLLEEQGLLSMSDPIQKYLPWLALQYQGSPVDMQSLTLNHFLHHTSGFTNTKHTNKMPRGDSPDMLQKTVEYYMGVDLAYLPGERYNYGTINYDVLGLVIEVVSGQRYEDYMTEKVFQPLGLNKTYLYKETAQATGQLAQGYRSSFFITAPYMAPDFGGNKPAGYIISSARDMARWMNIQLGNIEDIPDIFRTVIEKSHQGDTSVPSMNRMYYAAGWEVNSTRTVIEHAGGNPNFATNVIMYPNEQIAVCLLSNGTNTNIDLVHNVKNILDGKYSQKYKMSATQSLDIALSSATIIICLLAFIFIIKGFQRKKKKMERIKSRKISFATYVCLVSTFIMILVCLILPMFIGFSWSTILLWQTYSLLTALISLALLSASITWFAYARRY